MIISRTPFRISFFGGGTDFPEYYSNHGGATLSTTVDKFCYVLVHRLGPYFKHRFKASYARTESVARPSEFQHPLIRECLLFLNVRDGVEISHVSDLPGRTGLGTSSSFTVGLLHSLHAFLGDSVSAEDLARESIHVERERVGDAGGHQDQYAAAYGGFLRLNYRGDQQVEVRRLSLTAGRLRELQGQLLVFYTGLEQSAESILREQSKRTPRNTRTLRAMAQMVDQAERILCGRASLNAFGDLLHESWQLKKGLSTGISNSSVDACYAAARKAGARGGKLLGAGGRGFLLLFVPPERKAKVRVALKGLQEVRFGFEREGSKIIHTSP